MSHEISTVNGQAEVFTGRNLKPWHNLGATIPGLATAAEALRLAHLDWTVKGYPVTVNGRTLKFPSTLERGQRDTPNRLDDCWKGICREDTGECLGIMRGRYHEIQNADAFDFFDSLVGQGKAVYDTAGALRGGRQVWLLAKIDGTVKMGGDDTEQYALLLTSHDGSYALQCSFVTCRVVCANTLAVALNGAKNTIKIRHTRGWADKEDEARRVLGLGNTYFESVSQALDRLGSHLLTPEQMADFSKLMAPAADEGDVPTRTANIRAELNRLFETGPGNKGSTRLDALNAVTDFADHYQTMRGPGSTRIESAILGTGAELKQKAFEYLTSEEIMADLLNRNTKSRAVRVAEGDFNALLSKPVSR